MLNKSTNHISIKPYKLVELANIYGVDKKTFRNWLKPFQEKIGERIGYYYTRKQVDIIFDCLCMPELINLEDL